VKFEVNLGLRAKMTRALLLICCAAACSPGAALTDAGSDAGESGTPDAGVDGGQPPNYCAIDAGHGLGGPVAISGDPGAPGGFGDPSVLYPTDAGTGYLTYTAVAVASANTRWASSTDHGATWTYGGDVNAVTPLTIVTSDDGVCDAGMCTGSWVHEVSSLIDDPGDPDSTRRYKVFTHSYFINALGQEHYEIGSIDLWTTAAMQAGAVWGETRLLGWQSSSSQSSAGVATVVTTDPQLSPLLGNCYAMTEPGALAHDGVIELALGCESIVPPASVPIEISLIRSYDHAATWSPVAKLLSVTDAAALGGTGQWGPEVNAADLFVANGVTYLFASPNGAVVMPTSTSGYRGCVVIPFQDLDAGQLVRCGTAPAVVASFQDPNDLFNGACTYAEGASAAGVMGLDLDNTRSPPFQLWASGIDLP
jgi:hypothetical protein